MLATVARRLGDLEKAEDAVQEAFAAAAARWPLHGIPERPGAWLTTIAWRKAVDALRRDRLPLTSRVSSDGDQDQHGGLQQRTDDHSMDSDLQDDVLSLVLTCCHPALSAEAQIALTLRHVAGLTDRQIASRFLVPEATMTKRLVRARAKIRDARITFELPDRTRLGERIPEVQTVIYLIFTEGYLAGGDGPSVRRELCDEAVWLARQLHRLAPDDEETAGLLALLLLQHARVDARQDEPAAPVPYEEQDRARWDVQAIEQAKRILATTGRTTPGFYQLQAAIALLHCTAASVGDLDWPLIADLYRALSRVQPSVVVEVNRAVAVGRASGPQAGLAVLQTALDDPRLADYPSLHAAHADLLERSGNPAAAIVAWTRAAECSTNARQRERLLQRAADVTGRHIVETPLLSLDSSRASEAADSIDDQQHAQDQ